MRSIAKEKEKQRNIRRMFKMLREVWLSIGVKKLDTYEGVMVKVLLDSGTTRVFMDKRMAKKHGFKLQKLKRPLMVKNMDGTAKSGGAITHQVEYNVYYKGHIEKMQMDVCNLGKTDVILGMPWLVAHNPEINWETGEVKMTRCPAICRRKEEKTEKRKIGKKVRSIEKAKRDEWEWTMKEKFDKEIEQDKEKVREMVPWKFHKWLKVFEKTESERMPVRKPWDHAINLREDFIPKKGRTYMMSRQEKEEVREFVEEQLRKGYIRPSKSPQTSPVFFVRKKDEKKRMVQDYRYLNKRTIRDNYPLPLISDLIDTMSTKRVFTKMDLCWGYNNVQIKEVS